jgi:hypothetical protein
MRSLSAFAKAVIDTEGRGASVNGTADDSLLAEHPVRLITTKAVPAKLKIERRKRGLVAKTRFKLR